MTAVTVTRGFADTSYAARFREIQDRRTLDLMNQLRPNFRYGSVTSIDAVTRTAQVQFPESAPASVTVSYGSMAPSKIGQRVRVGGDDGDLWIIDVLGYVQFTGIDPADLFDIGLTDGIVGYRSITATWSPTLGFPQYKIEWSTDPGFATIDGEVISNNLESQVISDLDPTQAYYLRIFAGNGTGDFGSAGPVVGPRQPLNRSLSDGLIPASSPQPIVTGGIRSLTVEWLPADAGEDTVTYEVYASTVSGFAPDVTTLVAETPATSFRIEFLADGSPVPVDGSNTFVRLIAKDPDGRAAAGAQGFDAARLVELGDVGNVPSSAISDGVAPPNSPTPAITEGPGYLWLNWAHTINADAVTYEVHISTVSNFVPATNTLVAETRSTFTMIRAQSAADGGGPLNYAATYYVKLVSKDNDDDAPEGTQVSATVPRTTTADIEPLSITSALIGDAQVGTLKLVDGSITSAKIGTAEVDTINIANGAVGTLQVNDGSITTAKIGLGQITTALIGDAQITNAKISTIEASKITAGSIGAETIVMNGIDSILRSNNWVSGTAGWIIRGDGTAEFNQVDIVNSLDIGGADGTSWHVDEQGNMWAGAGTYGAAPFRVSNTGDAIVNNLTVNGTHNISATTQNYSGTNTVIYGGATNVESGNYSGTTAGWQVTSGGAATFNGGLTVGNGDLTLDGGSIRTDNAYPRVEIDGNEVTGNPDMKMMTSATQYSWISGNGGFTEIGQTVGQARMKLGVASATMETLDGAIIVNDTFTSLFQSGTGSLELGSGIASLGPPLVCDSYLRSGGKITINGTLTNPAVANTGSGTLQFQNNSITHIQLNDNTNYPQIRLGTTAVTTNPLIADSSGAGLKYIRISTSSEAIKDNITRITDWRAVQMMHQVDPVTFRSRIPSDSQELIMGFTAENLASVDPALASFDEETGEPTGINQVAVLSLLVSTVQYLDKRVRDLEGRGERRRYKKTITAGESGVTKRKYKMIDSGDGTMISVEKDADELAYEASLPADYRN